MRGIRENYFQALNARGRFTREEKQRVQGLLSDIFAIKEETEQKALALGIAQSCRASIPVCKGECCRLHFPKTFTAVDFIIAVEGLAPAQIENLTNQINRDQPQNRKCMFQKPDGCLLAFYNRPMVCTNAYPCFMSRAYWEFKEDGNRRAKPIFGALERLILSNDQAHCTR